MQTPKASPASGERLCRFPEVAARSGLKKSALYERIRSGDFPSPVKIGQRAVAWPESAIDLWIASRINAARECAQ